MKGVDIMSRAAKGKPKIDWRRVDAMTDQQRHAAALTDPDARPLTEEGWAKARPVVHALIIRRQLKLSQEAFAAQFHIPIGTLRDWEQRRKEPDAAARAYLQVIARAPDAVRRALKRPPVPTPRTRAKAPA